MTSCQKEVAEVANPPQEFKPNGNEILTTEKLIGEDKQHSSFEKAIDDGLGNFYFAGYINEQNVIGKIDKQGFIIWQKSINFKVNEIVLFYGAGNLEKSALIVGNDGNRAVVAIYDRNGTKLSDAYFNDFAINTFNDVRYRHTATNYYLCSAIGGAGNSENDISPYWVNFTISSNGQISKAIPNVNLPAQIRLTQYPRIRFNKFANVVNTVTFFDSQPIPNTLTYTLEAYISYSERDTEGKILSAGMFAFNDEITYKPQLNSSGGDITKTDLKFIWQRSVGGQTPNAQIFLGKSIVIGNEITVVGSAQSTDKKTNASVGFFSAAKIVVLNKSGSIVSNREFSISQYSDIISDINLIIPKYSIIGYDNNGNPILQKEDDFDEGVYICGTVSNYTKDQDYFYGYGWIAEISSGSIGKSRYFGFPSGRHYFNRLVVTGQNIYVFGFKNYFIKGGGHKAWFAQINRNGL
ncbi:MAG: hypothetical protein EAZ97_03270 [Bacteroidetes bacterium]|nr:MAG: hypothetical protein EAZ97_03270 [Bacteroidota bacterium]